MTKLRADFTRFRVLKAAFGPGLSPTWHPVPAVRQGLSPQSHPPASALSPQSQASPSLRLGTESPDPLKYLSLCVSLQSRAGLTVAWTGSMPTHPAPQLSTTEKTISISACGSATRAISNMSHFLAPSFASFGQYESLSLSAALLLSAQQLASAMVVSTRHEGTRRGPLQQVPQQSARPVARTEQVSLSLVDIVEELLLHVPPERRPQVELLVRLAKEKPHQLAKVKEQALSIAGPEAFRKAVTALVSAQSKAPAPAPAPAAPPRPLRRLLGA